MGKFTEWDAVETPTGNEEIPVSVGGPPKKMTANQVAGLVDISGKADKVASPTSGNIAGLDENGNPTDSGVKPADFESAGAAAVAVGAHESNYHHKANSVVKDADAVLTAAEMSDMALTNDGQTAEDTIEFAAAAAGLGGEIDFATPGIARHHKPNASDKIIFNGVDLTTGCKFTNQTPAAGDKLLVRYLTANTWNIVSLIGTYLTPLPIQATFTAGDQSFANAQVIDMLAEGVQQGSGTVAQSLNTHAISSNKLRCTYNGDAEGTAGVLFSNTIPYNSGMALFFTIDAISGTQGPIIGFFSTASLSAVNSCAIWRYSTSLKIRNVVEAVAGTTHAVVGANEEIKICIVLGTTYNFYFILREGETDWELIAVYPNGNDGNGYFGTSDNAATYDLSNVVLSRTAPDIQTPVYLTDSPDENAHDVGSGDLCALFTFTMPESGTDELRIKYRIATLGTDEWELCIYAGTSSTDFIMRKVVGGVPGAAVASADVDWVHGAQYTVALITNGDSEQRAIIFRPGVAGSSAPKLVYTGTDPTGATETEIAFDDVTGAVYGLDSIWVRPRVDSGVNTALSAASGSIY